MLYLCYIYVLRVYVLLIFIINKNKSLSLLFYISTCKRTKDLKRISPSGELKNSVSVGKFFYKANTLANVSLGYVNHVEKNSHLSHMGKPRFRALFLNDACIIW